VIFLLHVFEANEDAALRRLVLLVDEPVVDAEFGIADTYLAILTAQYRPPRVSA
jgi:hypothetical protein